MAANVDALYETDFCAWTRRQARELRRLKALRLNVELDLDHVAEEIEDLGTSERDTCRSQVERILEHFLKLTWSPSPQPRRCWQRSIVDARTVLDNKLSALMCRDLAQRIRCLYDSARRAATLDAEDVRRGRSRTASARGMSIGTYDRVARRLVSGLTVVRAPPRPLTGLNGV